MNRSCFALCTLLVAMAGGLFAGSACGEDGRIGSQICPLAQNQCSDYLNSFSGECCWANPAEYVPLPPPLVNAKRVESQTQRSPWDESFWREVLLQKPAMIVVSIPSGPAAVENEEVASSDFCSGYDEQYDAAVYGVERATGAIADEVVNGDTLRGATTNGIASAVEEAFDPLVPPAPVSNYANVYEYGVDPFGYDWYGFQSRYVDANEAVADDDAEYDEYWNEPAESASESEIAGAQAADVPAEAVAVDEYNYDEYYGTYDYYEDYYDEYDSTDYSDAEIAESTSSDGEVDWYEDYYYDYDQAAVVGKATDAVAETPAKQVLPEVKLAKFLPVTHALIKHARNGDIQSLVHMMVEAQRRAVPEPEEDVWGELAEADEAPAAEPADTSHVAIPVASAGKQSVLFIAVVLDEIGASLRNTSDRLVELVQDPVDISRNRKTGETR